MGKSVLIASVMLIALVCASVASEAQTAGCIYRTSNLADPGYLSDYANGSTLANPTDQTSRINKALDCHKLLYIDRDANGPVYGFDGSVGLRPHSDQTVRNVPGVALADVPPLALTSFNNDSTEERPWEDPRFVNRGFYDDEPVENFTLMNLRMFGRGHTEEARSIPLGNGTTVALDKSWNETATSEDKDDDRLVGSAFQMRTQKDQAGNLLINRNIRVENVYIEDWPGQAIKLWNVETLTINNVVGEDIARGGVVLPWRQRNTEITNSRMEEVGDDAFSLAAGEGEFAYEFRINNVHSSTRAEKIQKGGGNTGHALRGARNGHITNSSHYRSFKSGLEIQYYKGSNPVNIRAENNNYGASSRGADKTVPAILVEALDTTGILIRNNTIDNADHGGTGWWGVTGARRTVGTSEDLNNRVINSQGPDHCTKNIVASDLEKDWADRLCP